MSRSLVFLFDGTSNDPTVGTGARPTNVFSFNSLVADAVNFDGEKQPQITFYLPGIGTKFYSDSFIEKIMSWLIGIGTDAMLTRAYINLISNFRPGDRVSAIGFSRGAIAARLFTRLILDFGILQNKSIELFERQIEEFRGAIKCSYAEYSRKSAIFRAEHKAVIHQDITLQFLGLFDCVCGPHDVDFVDFLNEVDDKSSIEIESFVHLMSIHDSRGHFVLSRLRASKDVSGREIWMPGVHSDVGGGYDLDAISKISKLTMAYYAKKAKIALDPVELRALEGEVKSLKQFHINIESKYDSGGSRIDQISAGDTIHALHNWLSGLQINRKGAQDIYDDSLDISGLVVDDVSIKVVSLIGN